MTNKEKADMAGLAVDTYASCIKMEHEKADKKVEESLLGIMHYCGQVGVSFLGSLREATKRYESER